MSKSDEVISLFDRYVMNTYARNRLVFEKGRGTKVWDADGKVYLDLGGGIAVTSVGHTHPAVVEAIQKQAATLVHTSNLYYTENQGRLAEALSMLSFGGKCFFCNSGAEANEGLIKLARLWGHDTGRYEIIVMKNSFHGRTLATIAATGQDKVKKGFDPLPEGFVYADFNDVESVRALVTEKTVAVLLEAVQGEGGVVPATDEFMKGVRTLCDEKNLLMLCDEVQCGMGRTGSWFAFQGYGVDPDAFSLAKGLGNGFPIGAVVANKRLSEVFKPGNHASTFGGTPLACAAALATIKTIEGEGLVARAQQMGELFMEGLQAFTEQYENCKEARGRGLMLGLVFDKPVKPLVEKLAEAGLLALNAGENVLRFLPPLTMKDGELEEALDIIGDCLEDWLGAKPAAE